MKKKYLPAAAVLVIALSLQTGCSVSREADPAVTTTQSSEEMPQTEAPDKEDLFGFTVTESGSIGELSAETTLFTHEKSGAQLLYIKNDDKELGFSISYRTPYVDETDTNHIFEHAIIASSEKYPSKDLFFDIVNQSYNSYINAFTYSTFTQYPVCSQSEEQLLKLADAYLSCMVAPGVMEDENIFKREALRFELENADAPITMQGTVFSEDSGFMSNIMRNTVSASMKALYPGTTAANMIGMLHMNYKDLTYEKMKATYDRCYHFDNSLMILYGDVDYKKFLEMIDREYLSDTEKNGTDLSLYTEEPISPGHVEERVESPAYEGDATEQASVIMYTVDLSGSEWEDIVKWSVYANMLNNDNSPLQKYAKEEGIMDPVSAEVYDSAMKPFLMFYLMNTDEDKKDAFMSAVDKTLEEVENKGIDKDIYETVLKEYEISRYTARDQTQVSINAGADIVDYWSHTGRADYYNLQNKCLEKIENDSDQELLKEMAGKTRKPVRSACVTVVPVPGLAEKLEQEQTDYLTEMKASMTETEIEQMVADTKAFKQWNEEEMRNSDFMIEPEDLPEPDFYSDFEKKQLGEITSYTAPVEVEKAGYSQIYFDISNIPSEDLYYLPLYQLLLGQMDTEQHSAEEMINLTESYLYGLSFTEYYPEDEAGANARPMTAASWYSMTEDYETSLNLLMELIGQTDFTDTGKTKEIMEKYLPIHDQSRYADKLNLATGEAMAYLRRNRAFRDAVSSQEQYRFMEQELEKLKEDEEYGKIFSEKMEEISNCLLNKNGMIIMNAGAREDVYAMEETAGRILGSLPSIERKEQDYESYLRRMPKSGIIVESSDQCITLAADMKGADPVTGADISFLRAAIDRYITPRLRFQMGAYSAAGGYFPYEQLFYLYTYSDPNLGESLDVFSGLGDYLREADISQEELNGYILGAYGEATRPLGIYSRVGMGVWCDIAGIDKASILNTIRQIAEAKAEDKDKAAERLDNAIKNGGYVVVGNQKKLEADSSYFDEIKNYKGQ